MATIQPFIIMEESNVTKRLNTWLDVKVFNALTDFCKSNMTGLGKWDYSTGLRILLMKASYSDLIFELEKRIEELENKAQENKQSIPEGYYEVKTLGSTKLEDNKNE